MNYLHLLIDLAVVVALLVFYLRGRKKGFILVLCGLAAIFVALFGARFLSQQFAPMVADSLTPHFTAMVEEKLEVSPNNDPDQFLTGEADENSPLKEILELFGLEDPFADPVRDAFNEQLEEAAVNTVSALAHAIAKTVAEVVLFIVAFILLLILWALISRLLNLAAKLPIINVLNRLLGGFAGLIQGALILFFVAWLLRIWNVIPADVLDSTTVLKFFATTNPVSLITGI